MNPITNILQSYQPMILDGALATEFEKLGCDLNDPLWSAKVLLEQPQLIQQVHRQYFEAGADCAITASYQASFDGFARRGLSTERAAELMRLSVQLAAAARDDFWTESAPRNRPKPIIAASIGSYGAFLADGSEYRGNYGLTETQLKDFHRPRIAVLADSGADILACETIPCLLEAQALTHLLTEFPQITAWISFTAKDENHISQGETLADCADWLDAAPQIVAVGINCSPPKYLTGLIKSAASKTTKPIIVYPNSGESYCAEHKKWQGSGEYQTYHQLSQQWYQSGAKIIGGCCRTTPADIRQIADWARNTNRVNSKFKNKSEIQS